MNHIEITPVKTYANEKNMLRAIRKTWPDEIRDEMLVRYFTAWTENGRCFPIFVGMKALEHGIHWKFNIVA